MELRIFLIGIGSLFGALAMYCGMRLIDHYKRKEADQKKKDEEQIARIAQLQKEVTDLKEQIHGKQLPYFLRDGLEDIKALENADLFDLTRIRMYLEEGMKTVDQAADRQKRMADLYSAMRNHKKLN